MSEKEVKKDKKITLRLSNDIYNKFYQFINNKSDEVGTKLTQAQAFELLLNNKK